MEMRMEPERPKNLKDLAKAFVTDETSSGKPPTAEDMKKGARIALTAAALSAAPSEGAAQSISIRSLSAPQAQSENLSFLDTDVLAENVFYEARSESPKGQLAVAQVTLARLLSKRFGSTIPAVVFAKNQFSWTKEPPPLTQKELHDLAELKAIFARRIKGKDPAYVVQEFSKLTGIPIRTYYYKRTDWDEFAMTPHPHMSEKTKAMFRSLVRVGEVGKHTFYADPPPLPKRLTRN
ncbi:cell wall hydrolase [Candidatus Kaiserbacteria bacterium]|nr:cell wall hydrolase [Candidatus Kaiserbacteria bacterium]